MPSPLLRAINRALGDVPTTERTPYGGGTSYTVPDVGKMIGNAVDKTPLGAINRNLTSRFGQMYTLPRDIVTGLATYLPKTALETGANVADVAMSKTIPTWQKPFYQMAAQAPLGLGIAGGGLGERALQGVRLPATALGRIAGQGLSGAVTGSAFGGGGGLSEALGRRLNPLEAARMTAQGMGQGALAGGLFGAGLQAGQEALGGARSLAQALGDRLAPVRDTADNAILEAGQANLNAPVIGGEVTNALRAGKLPTGAIGQFEAEMHNNLVSDALQKIPPQETMGNAEIAIDDFFAKYGIDASQGQALAMKNGMLSTFGDAYDIYNTLPPDSLRARAEDVARAKANLANQSGAANLNAPLQKPGESFIDAFARKHAQGGPIDVQDMQAAGAGALSADEVQQVMNLTMQARAAYDSVGGKGAFDELTPNEQKEMIKAAVDTVIAKRGQGGFADFNAPIGGDQPSFDDLFQRDMNDFMPKKKGIEGDKLTSFPNYDDNPQLARKVEPINNAQVKWNNTGTTSARDALLKRYSTPEGQQMLQDTIDQIPKTADGKIVAYRTGKIGSGPQSYTLSEMMAKTFSNQGTDIPPLNGIGLPDKYDTFGDVNTAKVLIDPKDIVAWSPFDAEILAHPPKSSQMVSAIPEDLRQSFIDTAKESAVYGKSANNELGKAKDLFNYLEKYTKVNDLSDTQVNALFSQTKRLANHIATTDDLYQRADTKPMQEIFNGVLKDLSSASSREDKVLAIDKFVSAIHKDFPTSMLPRAFDLSDPLAMGDKVAELLQWAAGGDFTKTGMYQNMQRVKEQYPNQFGNLQGGYID